VRFDFTLPGLIVLDMKRDYDWSSMVTKVEIIEAAKPEPADFFSKLQTPVSRQPSGTIEREYEEPPMKVSWIPKDVPATKENLLQALQTTEDERRRIWNIDQREPEWLHHRLGRLSGSKVGSAVGHNRYESPQKLIQKWLYVPTKDNYAMKWGRDHEDEARELYRSLRIHEFSRQKTAVQFEPPPRYLDSDYQTIDNVVPIDPNDVSSDPYTNRVEVRGLVIHPTIPWFGYSPDGEVFETDDKGLLEIKCPQKRPYSEIPWSYYDQIQFGMFNFNLKWCDFFVWTPAQSSLHRYAFNEDYWNHDLYPKLEDFYMNRFLPEAIVAIEKERAWDPNAAKYTKKLHI
jgi:hypothetical protein